MSHESCTKKTIDFGMPCQCYWATNVLSIVLFCLSIICYNLEPWNTWMITIRVIYRYCFYSISREMFMTDIICISLIHIWQTDTPLSAFVTEIIHVCIWLFAFDNYMCLNQGRSQLIFVVTWQQWCFVFTFAK